MKAVNSSAFYASLYAHRRFYDGAWGGGMEASLPPSERRTVDMARASLMKASNNYGGNQPNYGFGATYWSYGREDNGSLPLDTLSTDDALLDWGVCHIGLAHVGFYLRNYVAADGSINYYSWGAGQKDSISDQWEASSSFAGRGLVASSWHPLRKGG